MTSIDPAALPMLVAKHKEEIAILNRRVDELQGESKALMAALRLALSSLMQAASQSPAPGLAAVAASLQQEFRLSAEFYAEHALATAIPDAHIDTMRSTLIDLASLLKPAA